MKTLNYTYRNLRLETACNNIFIKFKMSRNPLLERDSCSLILASDNQMLAFWAVTYVRFDCISFIILLHEKFLQFDWLRAVVFQLNLKYLHVKITNLLRVVV